MKFEIPVSSWPNFQKLLSTLKVNLERSLAHTTATAALSKLGHCKLFQVPLE
jgi:hypothetical protein